MGPERVFVVQGDCDGERLDRFLADQVGRLSRSKARRILRSPACRVRLEPPRRVKPATRVRAGDKVILRRPDEGGGPPIPIRIVHSDPHALVIDKPSGALVHPTARVFSATVSHRLREASPPGERWEPAHRIDQGTSGALLVARRPEVVPQLRGLFAGEGGGVDKLYLAAVDDPERRWTPGRVESLRDPLGLQQGGLVRIKMGPGPLEARTDVGALARSGDRALLACRLFTGRQHQIRAHLAMAGTPILGDPLYQMGERFFNALYEAPDDPDLIDRLPWPRLALHAAALAWRCPVEGEDRRAEVPLPGDFPDLLDGAPWNSCRPDVVHQVAFSF